MLHCWLETSKAGVVLPNDGADHLKAKKSSIRVSLILSKHMDIETWLVPGLLQPLGLKGCGERQ